MYKSCLFRNWLLVLSMVYSYDPMGGVVEMKDPLENSWQYQYDPLGRLVNFTDRNGGTTEYQYDANGNLIAVITDEGIINYSYTVANKLKQGTFPDGRSYCNNIRWEITDDDAKYLELLQQTSKVELMKGGYKWLVK